MRKEKHLYAVRMIGVPVDSLDEEGERILANLAVKILTWHTDEGTYKIKIKYGDKAAEYLAILPKYDEERLKDIRTRARKSSKGKVRITFIDKGIPTKEEIKMHNKDSQAKVKITLKKGIKEE